VNSWRAVFLTDKRKQEAGKFYPHNNVDIQSQLKISLMAIHNYVEVGRSLVKQGYTHEKAKEKREKERSE